MTDYVRGLRAIVGGDVLLQVPSAAIALRDGEGRVLLARHVEGDVWVLPGGAIEPRETPEEAAVREMREETGLTVSLTRVAGVFSGPAFVVQYRNGDRASYVITVFEATSDTPNLKLDPTELAEARFVTRSEAAALPLARWMPEVLDSLFASGPSEVLRLHEAWSRAWLEKDAAVVETLAAEEYAYVAPNGHTLERATVLNIIRSPSYRLFGGARSEVRVQRIGPDSVAIVDRWQGEGTYDGQTFKEDHRCTHVWARRGPAWKLVLEHCSPNS